MPQSKNANLTFLVIARVASPQGNKGELKAELVTDFPERFASTPAVFLGDERRRYRVESYRLMNWAVVLKLEGIDTISEAEKHRGSLIEIPREEAVALPDGHYYWHQILGLKVVTTEGEEIGTVGDILQTGSNDVYVVSGSRGEQLIPAIKETIKSIDLATGLITIEPMEWTE